MERKTIKYFKDYYQKESVSRKRLMDSFRIRTHLSDIAVSCLREQNMTGRHFCYTHMLLMARMQ